MTNIKKTLLRAKQCQNLVLTKIDMLNTLSATNINNLFNGCPNLVDTPYLDSSNAIIITYDDINIMKIEQEMIDKKVHKNTFLKSVKTCWSKCKTILF